MRLRGDEMSRGTIRIGAITLAILGALAFGLGPMANTASAQSVLDVVKNVTTKAKDKVKGKVAPGKKGPAALPGIAKKGKQLLDPKAKQLIGSKGAPGKNVLTKGKIDKGKLVT